VNPARFSFDSGSFRDRCGRVVIDGEGIFRVLTAEGLAGWNGVANLPFFQRLMADGQIIKTTTLADDFACRFDLPAEYVAVLQHERIPFVSYPYEWSFGMLRQAALLHLKVLASALDHGWILKDASPFNVQFCGIRSVFIDTGSFVKMLPSEPWLAYRQFCEMMLFPLLLQAYRNVDFQPLIRGSLDGISCQDFSRLISWRDMLRPGVFSHVWLQAVLDRNTQTTESTVSHLQSEGFHPDMIRHNITKLTRLMTRLHWTPAATRWTNYRTALPHVLQDTAAKLEFVKNVCHSRRWPLVWDLGCNDGAFSRIAAQSAETVVAMDSDHGCVERLYQALCAENSSNILPLCIDLENQSPAMGWRGCERKPLEERGMPNLVLCLGIIHHLVIGHNIPLSSVTDWLSSLGGEIVLEFPSKKDPMVQALLQNKRDQYSDYSLALLDQALARHFEIRHRIVLPSGERTLLHAVPKNSQRA